MEDSTLPKTTVTLSVLSSAQFCIIKSLHWYTLYTMVDILYVDVRKKFVCFYKVYKLQRTQLQVFGYVSRFIIDSCFICICKKEVCVFLESLQAPRTFSNHIITEIARCGEFCHMSSGRFDCTEPPRTSSNLLEPHHHRDSKVWST